MLYFLAFTSVPTLLYIAYSVLSYCDMLPDRVGTVFTVIASISVVLWLFYDNISPGTVANKIQSETNSNTRGKLFFYLAEFYSLQGNEVMAEKYYTTVHELQCPIFFEYRMNEWAYAALNAEEKK